MPAATAAAPAVLFAAAAGDRPICARCTTVLGMEEVPAVWDEDELQDDSWRNELRDHGFCAIEPEGTPHVGGAPRSACVAGKDHPVGERLQDRAAASATARPPRAADRIAARRAVPTTKVTYLSVCVTKKINEFLRTLRCLRGGGRRQRATTTRARRTTPTTPLPQPPCHPTRRVLLIPPRVLISRPTRKPPSRGFPSMSLKKFSDL